MLTLAIPAFAGVAILLVMRHQAMRSQAQS
jgi:hypothetical protein